MAREVRQYNTGIQSPTQPNISIANPVARRGRLEVKTGVNWARQGRAGEGRVRQYNTSIQSPTQPNIHHQTKCKDRVEKGRAEQGEVGEGKKRDIY